MDAVLSLIDNSWRSSPTPTIQTMGPRYFYYRVFDQDGALDSKASFSEEDKTLGRLNANSIAPPHIAASIKHRIAKQEQLANHSDIALYLNLEDDTPIENSVRVNLSIDGQGPGSTPENPIGLVIATPESPEANAVDIAGEWRADEVGGSTKTHGTLMFTMITPTTFTGTGAETDTFPGGRQLSYTFKIVDGTITNNTQISWLCDSIDINGKWRINATLASDGLTMTGLMTAVSGGNIVGGTGTYTRIRR